ncbi:unnamed protein product [Orchesella dallaii]|uniref:PDZ domain-containing protein n=1 Tax=Orchesella dallaii TaxID=48710 RepID=A0ABP1RGY0_9HEXA
MGTEALFQQNTFFKVKGWPWTAWQATRRFGALHSFGIGALWLRWAEWVLKASDEKALQSMKGTFPSATKLEITGNLAVFSYTFLILQGVAFACFAAEYLLRFICGIIKNKNKVNVANDDQSLESTMEPHNIDGESLFESATDQSLESTMEPHNIDGKSLFDSAADQSAAEPAICSIQPTTAATTVETTVTVEVHRDGADLSVSIVGDSYTHPNSIDEAIDAHLQSGDDLLSLNNENFQNVHHSNALDASHEVPKTLKVLVNCHEATDDENNLNDDSDISEGEAKEFLENPRLRPYFNYGMNPSEKEIKDAWYQARLEKSKIDKEDRENEELAEDERAAKMKNQMIEEKFNNEVLSIVNEIEESRLDSLELKAKFLDCSTLINTGFSKVDELELQLKKAEDIINKLQNALTNDDALNASKGVRDLKLLLHEIPANVVESIRKLMYINRDLLGEVRVRLKSGKAYKDLNKKIDKDSSNHL